MKFCRSIAMMLSLGGLLGFSAQALIAQTTNEQANSSRIDRERTDPKLVTEAGSAAEILQHFEQEWNEALWEQPFRTFRDGYIRPLDDSGLELRMKAFQQLVSLGETARTDLLTALASPSAPVRMLAAQAIGFLASETQAAETQAAETPSAELMAMFSKEPDPSVRLYLADSIGRFGTAPALLQALHDSESNNDVKKHLNYAMERRGQTLDPKIRESLINYDPQNINSVKLDQPAPDIELQSADGRMFRLSDQKGKSAIILVFVYGDT